MKQNIGERRNKGAFGTLSMTEAFIIFRIVTELSEEVLGFEPPYVDLNLLVIQFERPSRQKSNV